MTQSKKLWLASISKPFSIFKIPAIISAMIPELTATITALKNVTDLTSLIIKATIDEKIREKTYELQRNIADIQASLMKTLTTNQELLNENSTLKEEITKIKNFAKESRNYTLYEVAFGFLVYAEKKSVESGSPTVWYCANCYQKTEKSILQMKEPNSYGTYYFCPNCKTEYLHHY